MSFKPKKTNDKAVIDASKTLVYALHGFGKTTQCKYYQEAFGPGFIMSGEGGLKSISDTGIDYLPFSSWNNKHDPANDIYSFRGICKMIQSKDFQDMGYKWIAIDSLTEASDLLFKELEQQFKDDKNGFKMWGEFARQMIGSLKWIRDLDYHVLVTALAKDEEDDNGRTTFWPHVHGKSAAKQIPALFDHVFAGVRETVHEEDGEIRVLRRLYSDEVYGYHGKIRDPSRRIPAVVNTSNIPAVINAMHLSSDEYDSWLKAIGENDE